MKIFNTQYQPISTMNKIVINRLLLVPQDGLILGNGDLSVSVYQAADEIRFRFGKGDVWDRRHDCSQDPKPAHIDEVRRGIEVEGWECGPYGGPVHAKNGSSNEARMREICQGNPPSYKAFPYPCPKPVGELAMRLPSDAQGLEINQTLDIESAEITVECRWKGGLHLSLVCFIAALDNVFCLKWKLEGWNELTRTTGDFKGVGPAQPVWFRLYRWNDPTIAKAGEAHFAQHRHPGIRSKAGPKASPLPPVLIENGAIVQHFPADTVFQNGFQCAMAPLSTEGLQIEPLTSEAMGGAMLHLLPDAEEGTLAIGVSTSSDPEGTATRLPTMAKGSFSGWRSSSRNEAQKFWERSSLTLAETRLQDLWTASLHAKRSTYRADTVPPGLFLPSTLGDYSLWHGDYHTNYNLQSIFLGDYAANHPEIGDAYFRAMDFFLPIGRKIARDYYGCRGLFIQLSGFATHPSDDPLGAVPMGRMAYMTGWAANRYWWRFQYTQNHDWLVKTGYPVLRDCALFYTDFLQLGADGLYHAFPSNQGEDGFSGKSEDFMDRPQILRHARYCLHIAVGAAKVLGVDPDLIETWSHILVRLPAEATKLSLDLAPELYCFDGGEISDDPSAQPAFLDPDSESYRWYPGKLAFQIIQALRTRRFIPDRDFLPTVSLLDRWTHDNGLLWAMSVGNYGHVGAWSESLGIVGAIQEMLLQSWEGYIRLFPGLPLCQDASFQTLRAEGAFLLSASRKDGAVQSIEILSEAGGLFRIENPWSNSLPIVETENSPNPKIIEQEGRILALPTESGGSYLLHPA